MTYWGAVEEPVEETANEGFRLSLALQAAKDEGVVKDGDIALDDETKTFRIRFTNWAGIEYDFSAPQFFHYMLGAADAVGLFKNRGEK